MLISYSKKFIFQHNYKVAGSSIKKALEKYALNSPSKFHLINRLSESNNFLSLLNYKISNKLTFIPNYRFHASALELKNELPDKIWNNFFKFAFVRNPWSWQVSLYHYALKNKYHFQHKLISSMDSFDEYIEWRVNEDFHTQKENLCDENGTILLDYIGKMESIHRDFNDICKIIGIKADLPHINKSNHFSYRNYYNEHTKKLINKYFIEDIEIFKYKF